MSRHFLSGRGSAELEALASSAARLHDWPKQLIASSEPGEADGLYIARDAERLATWPFDAVEQLKSRHGPDVEARAAA